MSNESCSAHRWVCSIILTVLAAAMGHAHAQTTKVFVKNGKPVDVVYDAEPWTMVDGQLTGAGNDNWLLASHGLVEGDFLIRATLTIHDLRHSAARFSFDCKHSFGFEGNHGRIYITNVLTPRRHGGIAHITPAAAGIRDGVPFQFEVDRTGNTIAYSIDGKEVYRIDVPQYTFDCFGFDPRRARVVLHDFVAEGNFSPSGYDPAFLKRWHHPATTLQETDWHGPFVNLANDHILTVVNVDDGIRAFVSADDGGTWEPAGRIRHPDTQFRIRDQNGDTLLLRTRNGTILCVFLNIANEKISWDRERQEPNPDMKRFTWMARSLDGGRTWTDIRVLQEGYCGALRDMVELTTGEIVLVGQDVARHPGRNVSFTYVSADDGKTWTKSNVLDIGGTGDHAGSIEGTLTERRDGRLWILLRSYHGHFYECFSSDRGRTWTDPAPSIKASGSPGILKRLDSGRLVLLWNRFADGRPRRVGRREELSIAFSEDDGHTWRGPLVILRERNRRQSYPQIFERRPGELWITTWQGRTFVIGKEDDLLNACGTDTSTLR